MGIFDRAAELSEKVAKHYEELVTIRVRFEDLHRNTSETMSEFKKSLERVGDKVNSVERDHVEAKAILTSQIESLSNRLDSLSEKALHAAMDEAARNAAEMYFNKKPEQIIDNETGQKKLT